jgi:hypothetical protein
MLLFVAQRSDCGVDLVLKGCGGVNPHINNERESGRPIQLNILQIL